MCKEKNCEDMRTTRTDA